jgi:hypothetical protein
MARAEAFLDDPRVAVRSTVLSWRIDRRWAIASALLLVASIASMTRVTEFLYFQF